MASLNRTAGKADAWGDGVVPVDSALLSGSTHIVLEDVYHSPLGSTDDDADAATASPRLWYGSRQVIDSWLNTVGGFDIIEAEENSMTKPAAQP